MPPAAGTRKRTIHHYQRNEGRRMSNVGRCRPCLRMEVLCTQTGRWGNPESLVDGRSMEVRIITAGSATIVRIWSSMLCGRRTCPSICRACCLVTLLVSLLYRLGHRSGRTRCLHWEFALPNPRCPMRAQISMTYPHVESAKSMHAGRWNLGDPDLKEGDTLVHLMNKAQDCGRRGMP